MNGSLTNWNVIECPNCGCPDDDHDLDLNVNGLRFCYGCGDHCEDF